MKKNKLIVLALIPVTMAIVEMIMWFSSLHYEQGAWVSDNSNFVAYLAIMGFFFLPFILLIPEIIGLILAIKRRKIGFLIIFIIEFLMTTVSCVISLYEFKLALSI